MKKKKKQPCGKPSPCHNNGPKRSGAPGGVREPPSSLPAALRSFKTGPRRRRIFTPRWPRPSPRPPANGSARRSGRSQWERAAPRPQPMGARDAAALAGGPRELPGRAEPRAGHPQPPPHGIQGFGPKKQRRAGRGALPAALPRLTAQGLRVFCRQVDVGMVGEVTPRWSRRGHCARRFCVPVFKYIKFPVSMYFGGIPRDRPWVLARCRGHRAPAPLAPSLRVQRFLCALGEFGDILLL